MMKKKRKITNYLIFALIPVSFTIMLLSLYFSSGIFELNYLGLINDFILVTVFFSLINLIFKNKIRKSLLTVFYVGISLILIADSVYYSNYSSFGSITSFAGFNNLFKGDLGVKLMFITIFLGLFSTATVILIWMMPFSLDDKPGNKIIILIIICILSININTLSIYYVKNKTYETKIEYYGSETFLYSTFYNSKKYAQTFGYINFRVRDITLAMDSKKLSIIEEDIDEVNNLFLKRDKKEENDVTLLLEGYNVITLMCETVDFRFIDNLITPNLYNLMYNESFQFTNYYTPTFFEGATINSEYMSQVSLYPITTSIWASNLGDQYYMNNFKEYSLATQMKNNGYNTYYFHNNTSDFYSRDELITNYGFEYMYYQEDLVELGYPQDNKDTSIINLLNNFINTKELFYANILTYSPHAGSDNVYTTEYLDYVNSIYPDVNNQLKVYYCKLMEFDKFIGLLINYLIENNIYDNTALFLYPDHYNYMIFDVYENMNLTENDLDKEINKQTLTLFLKGEKEKELEKLYSKNITLLGSTIDLAPTILNLTCKDVDYTYFLGNDIFDGDNIVVFSDYTIYNGTYFVYLDSTIVYNGEVILDYEVEYITKLLDILESKVEELELSRVCLQLDFFKYLKEFKNEEKMEEIIPLKYDLKIIV